MAKNARAQQRQQRGGMNRSGGFSLIELITVVAIASTLLAFAGMVWKQWTDQYNAESEIRKMHADLLQARAQAMGQNLQYLAVVGPGSYQIGYINDSGAQIMQTPVTLKYPISSPTSSMTLTFDTKGLITLGTASAIQFNTGSGKPEYDCLQLYETRIDIGRMNGTTCVPR